MAHQPATRVKLKFAGHASLVPPSSWLLVDSARCTHVADLLHIVKQKFALAGPPTLTLDGCVLPAHEPIAIVRDNDELL